MFDIFCEIKKKGGNMFIFVTDLSEKVVICALRVSVHIYPIVHPVRKYVHTSTLCFSKVRHQVDPFS